MIKLLYGIVITTLCLASTLASSDEKIIVDLVLPAKNSSLDSLAKKITDNPHFSVNTHINILPSSDSKGDVLIVVSEKLFSLLDNANYKAKFALYVNSNEFRQSGISNVSALYSDQPLLRQILLINAIFKNKQTQLGIAYKDPYYEKEFEDYSSKFPNISINSKKIIGNNFVRDINRIIQKNDVLLSNSENDIYNSKTIRSILLSSYRHQTIVIGPNEGFVTAGALGTVFSTPDQYAKKIIAMVNSYIETGELPDSQYPDNFNVKINYSVSESLGLSIPKEEDLKNSILIDWIE